METNKKKIMKKLALVLALAAATATEGMAQTKAASGKVSSSDKVSNLNVQDLGSLRFKLAFENPLRQKTQIYLLDKNKDIFFNEYATGTAQYVRAFDLSNLADGEYTFVVESGKDRLTKDFVIKTNTFRGVSLASNR
ncbi:hypothetical protein [Emticicia sp. SJ17W-69]|uniref:hypothetical protein n=1 Tax=Emticicia sp. SJ17W-69 TaxID=3421657 RepID=UPI003EBDF4B3